jgi:hypothetical protein
LKNLGDESWDANNPPTVEQEETVANPTTESEENHDAEVTRLFEDARDKLESIEASSKKQKRQIVVELAKSLEGKIATESICADIVSQLHGQVSAGFIRECLDEKYKQKHRVANARKQHKQRKGQQQKPGSSEDLAKVTTLNQEDDKVKKELIILDVDGRAMPQENKDEQNDEVEDGKQSSIPGAPSTAKHGSLTELQSPYPQEQQQEQEEREGTYNNDYPNNNHGLEDDEVDAEPEKEFEVSLQPDGQDGTADISAQNNKPNELKGDVMDFEFHMLYGRVSKYMAPLFQKIGDGGKVWFCGKIDKNTGKVISSSLGRLSQQQEKQQQNEYQL